MAMSHTLQQEICRQIRLQQPFEYRAITGTEGYRHATGELFQADKDLFLSDVEHAKLYSRTIYVVSSYGTPIGWHVGTRGWTIPRARYDARTSAHQRLLRIAVTGLKVRNI